MSVEPRRSIGMTEPTGTGHAASVSAPALQLGPAPRALGAGEPPVAGEAPVAPEPRPDFEEVYEALFDFAWRSARRLGVADAAVDDVVQETFLVVHRRLPGFEGRSSIKTWVFAILLRVVSDWRRSQRRKGGLASLDALAPHGEVHDERSPCPATELETTQALRLLHGLLDGLDDDRRAVFVLAELEQATAPEIAELLGIPLNTVYSRLRVARLEFEKSLARYRARESHRGCP
jgi:RNA polymerase sigma-70 factor, ECF subfamily